MSAVRRYGAASSSRANGIPPKGPGNLEVPVLFSEGTYATPNTGYFGGGEPGPKSIVDRIDYSNDTATASSKGPLTLAKSSLAATGNASFGYYGGGLRLQSISPSRLSSVDRVDYLNDTATASPKGPLTASKYSAVATGNNDFGYFGGGTPGPNGMSTVDRIDYSSDNVSARPKDK